jgi:hypothetical protein
MMALMLEYNQGKPQSQYASKNENKGFFNTVKNFFR